MHWRHLRSDEISEGMCLDCDRLRLVGLTECGRKLCADCFTWHECKVCGRTPEGIHAVIPEQSLANGGYNGKTAAYIALVVGIFACLGVIALVIYLWVGK